MGKRCPCGSSSDAYSIQDNGWGKCFSCDKNFHPKQVAEFEGKERVVNRLEEVEYKPTNAQQIRPLPENFEALTDRGISAATARKYKVTVNQNPNIDLAHIYPYFRDGIHVANQLRRRSQKGFRWEGDKAAVNELFGQHAFPKGSAKSITVFEGACDAMAGFELMGSRYPAVAVTSASTAVSECRAAYEYLDSFEKIYICFDTDEPKTMPNGEVRYPGQEAAEKVAGLFKIGKVHIVSLKEHKDANDYLRAGDGAKFQKEWWAAPSYMPAGLKKGSEMWDEINKVENKFSVPWPYESLNRFTYGIRLSEAVIIQAPTGIGKTSFFKECEQHVLHHPDVVEKGYGVGLLHLEESNTDTALGLMSIAINKPLHLPDVEVTPEEKREAFDKSVNTDRLVIWDHFGSNSIEEVLSKVRHMAALGCKYIFIDHLSIIVSDHSGDERKQLDEISTKLKTLTMELNIAVLCIVHENRQGEIRGSMGPEQLANLHLAMFRDKEDPNEWRRNVTKIVIKKNRFGRRTGPALWLWFNEATGRLEELSKEEADLYEAGGFPGGKLPDGVPGVW